MPRTSVTQGKQDRKLDARPDRIDLRDREFQPSLVSLPSEYPHPDDVAAYLPLYAQHLILDQKKEGACTGFGLAATINYLLFSQYMEEFEDGDDFLLERVSSRMLYQMARIYDEWPGEDYEGSSCRGAMKGWHRHGVCSEDLWPYQVRGRFARPKPGWQNNAATRPLGSYYRVNKDSIGDMQAAINEVGAIYVSAMVHDGWTEVDDQEYLPLIPQVDSETGGHAFAIVGYNLDGFIVQNSWGKRWGYCGFAVMTYEDWIQHGTDAWVAVLGAPMKVDISSRSFSELHLQDVESGRANWFWSSENAAAAEPYRNKKVQPLTTGEAYEHTLVLGNDGRPLNRYLDVEDAAAVVQEAVLENPRSWMTSKRSTKLAIYFHGGLNSEKTSLERIRIMAPYFRENGIYPLFLTWRTGFLETIHGMLEDVVTQFFSLSESVSRGWIEDLKQQIREAKDRTIEVACEQVLIKAVWTQMKQNAATGALRGGGLHMLAKQLVELKKEIPKLKVHIIGHSAGAYQAGYLLDELASNKLKAETCTLYAPACTVDFAYRHFYRANEKKVLAKKNIYCDVMSDERERADSVGPYGKSLLYLVSRALEEAHKTPILGMEAAWQDIPEHPDLWSSGVDTWRKFARTVPQVEIHNQKMVSDGRGEIPLDHGSFDNDVKVVTKTLERIRGSKLKEKVESLRGF